MICPGGDSTWSCIEQPLSGLEHQQHPAQHWKGLTMRITSCVCTVRFKKEKRDVFCHLYASFLVHLKMVNDRHREMGVFPDESKWIIILQIDNPNPNVKIFVFVYLFGLTCVISTRNLKYSETIWIYYTKCIER